ncbi:MAG: FAD-binding oxidoreductase [Aestuariivirga sp.]|uniref:FAD-binding oxidoreductase n=1 Tax=Aestuariivirga sp. TaxID=2650926 RepID=UPI0038D14A84
MTLTDRLRAEFGESALLMGADIGSRYCSDMSGLGKSPPALVIRPRSTAEVSRVLRLCNEASAPVIVQGGLTGLAGGAAPLGNEIAISLELMRGIEEVDTAAATMVVKAGTPLAECQAAAAEHGLFLALDLGSRGSCQIGGNLATNAGGIRVIRYGMMREQVLGLEAVLADGTVVSSMNRMLKNNAGYDLKQLFIGSEGTLGIITRAVLRLHPPPGDIVTALCAVESYPQVVALLRRAQTGLGGVMAFEAMWKDYFAFNTAALRLRFFNEEHPFCVILESSSGAGATEAFLAGCLSEGLIADALVAHSQAQERDIWSVREGYPIETLPNLLNFDVSLPIGMIGDYAEACTAALHKRWPAAHVSFYGHVGDSNVHICVSADYGPGESMHDVDEIVYRVLGGYQGSISAEHGIGTLKRPYLHLSRTPEELALMRRLKHALDPRGILNPGKVI